VRKHPEARPTHMGDELMTTEYWRPVKDYEGLYEVSNLGSVRSMDRSIHTKTGVRHWQGKLLKPRIGSGGYALVSLYHAGRVIHPRIHVLVLETFVGPRPAPDYDCCHNDGNAANNSLCNLRWDTRRENHADLVRHGTAWFCDPAKVEAQRERCRANIKKIHLMRFTVNAQQ